ncbi:MAG: helix-turn-helix transcriptional regulator [Lachnospiraceae bacterium]|nr:helix-turn-helix transcriptional regulator [Lachnospiraceae bacterium]
MKGKLLITNHIKEYRKAYGYSQEYLAKLTGLSQNSISDIESGKNGCTLGHAFLIAQAFGLYIEDVFSWAYVSENNPHNIHVVDGGLHV